MFNGHIFNGAESEKVLDNFLTEADKTKVALVMDPPFGGMVEPLASTVKHLSNKWRQFSGEYCVGILAELSHKVLWRYEWPIGYIWIYLDIVHFVRLNIVLRYITFTFPEHFTWDCKSLLLSYHTPSLIAIACVNILPIILCIVKFNVTKWSINLSYSN